MHNRARHSTARSRVDARLDIQRKDSSTPAISSVASLTAPISAVAGRANWPSYRCAMLYRPVGLFSAVHRVQVPDEVGLPARVRSWQRPKVSPEEIRFV